MKEKVTIEKVTIEGSVIRFLHAIEKIALCLEVIAKNSGPAEPRYFDENGNLQEIKAPPNP